jgi:lysosomal acid phosphatase
MLLEVAGRTILHTIIQSLERIAFNGDPLQFLLVESTYQPFISLFHQTEMINAHPELEGIRATISNLSRAPRLTFLLTADYASALAIELRRGPPPEDRDFLRFKFKNGTNGEFETRHVFGHRGDIPLTEFIYKIQVRLHIPNNTY